MNLDKKLKKLNSLTILWSYIYNVVLALEVAQNKNLNLSFKGRVVNFVRRKLITFRDKVCTHLNHTALCYKKNDSQLSYLEITHVNILIYYHDLRLAQEILSKVQVATAQKRLEPLKTEILEVTKKLSDLTVKMNEFSTASEKAYLARAIEVLTPCESAKS